MTAPIEQLAAAAAALTGQPSASVPVDSWKTAAWRDALLDLPLDERAYHDRFGVDRREVIERLWQWWSEPDAPRPQLQEQTVGYFGFYLLTLVAMHCSDRVRFHGEPSASVPLGETDAANICRHLVEDARVQGAIERLHHPRLALPAAAGAKRTAHTLKEWREVDFSTLEFHRHGTTSIILTGLETDPVNGRTARFALKCLIYPYLKVPAIAAATRDYLDDYGQLQSDTSPLVGVWASHYSWILMDFVPGRTLADLLRDRFAARPAPRREILRPIDIAQLDRLGTALLHALAELEDEGHHHDDLTPSNIIVQTDESFDRVRVRLIDLGVNHLHARSVSGSAQGEQAYVAPEVRAEGRGDDRADLYSLGMLLIAIGGIDLNADGTLPDQFYVTSVGMARLLEDLIDADPGRRLLVTGIDAGRNRFRKIGELFGNETEVLHESVRVAPVGVLEKLKSISPGAGTVARQRRIWQVRRDQVGGRADSAHLRRSRRLMRWAWLCSVLVWCTAALVVTWWARDLGISWQAKWLELLNNVFNRSGPGMVFFDDVRAEDYRIPDPVGNLPARMVGATFTLVAARMYLNLFAELSPASALRRRGMQRLRTVATEVSLRSFAVVPSVCVVVPTLVQSDWWPLATQAGLISTLIIISFCVWFQRDAHRRSRQAGLSMVPDVPVPAGRLAQWQPILLLYCVAVLVIGTLLMFDLLRDELAYASFVALINIAIYYFKSAGTDAPHVRAEMTRAFLAAERLDYLADRESKQVPPQREPADGSDADRRAPEGGSPVAS